MNRTLAAAAFLAISLSTAPAARAQTDTDLPVLRGLAPAAALGHTDAGRAALQANYATTGGIQTGDIPQPTLLPFALQEEQALQDAFGTNRNLAQLADGLGTTLGAAYIARFHYLDETHTSPTPPALAALIRYATGISGPHSNLGKFFLANGTLDGTKPASPAALALLQQVHGEPDVFGKAYHLPAGSPNGDRFGDARPFQTEKSVRQYSGPDYLNRPASNTVYNNGPLMNLVDSPSFPSGHTTYGYTGAVLLAVLVPERYSEMIARGAEYGNDRILVGAHYAMDVLAGRTLALYDMAHLLANDKTYLGRTIGKAEPVTDFQKTLKEARAELTPVLAANCGEAVPACAKEDIGRFSNEKANAAFYASTQTYGLPVVYPKQAATREDVETLAPEAGYLLTQAFPSLTLKQADRILTETEGPGGGFLDDGSSFGLYSRLDLYTASQRAAELVHKADAH